MSIDILLRRELRRPASIGRIVHPDLCAPNSQLTTYRKNLDALAARAHPPRVCLSRCPKRGWKSGSSRDPFFQTDVHDLPLLLGCLAEFGCLIIVQPAPQNLQNFAGRFSRRAYNENPPELLLVLAIPPLQRHLQGFIGRGSFLLLFHRPRRKLRPNSFFCTRFSDSRMTLKRLQPIRFA